MKENRMKDKIILGYSGGLDTSIMIPWLKENYDCEIVTVTCDLGQGNKELDGIQEKALKSGATKAYVEDVKTQFVTDFLWKLIKSGAKYEGEYLLGTLSRPLIAKKLVDIALKENATAICHGATGKGNDQVRFELAIKALSAKFKIIAPWRSWNISSRSEAIDYANSKGIPIQATKKSPYSIDRNIWYVSHEGGDLESTEEAHNCNFYQMTSPLESTLDMADNITIHFEAGIPVALNQVEYPPVELLSKLNEIGGKHGIGIVDIIENRLVGMKSRGVYETPGGTILFKAHQFLESICLDRNVLHLKQKLSQDYANLIYEGCWFTPLRESLDAFIDDTQKNMTGFVKLKLYKGHCLFSGASSHYSLYHKEFSTFEKDEVYQQYDAEGFINIFGLPLKIQTMMKEKNSNLFLSKGNMREKNKL